MQDILQNIRNAIHQGSPDARIQIKDQKPVYD
jgi:hypothetical protein